MPTAAEDPFVRELVVVALERMEEEGEVALEELCAQHPSHAEVLRRRVRCLAGAGLLRDARSFPERLGEFRLLEPIGSGGMGVVYRAVQESVGREVALKLIRPEQLYFPGARQRFRREVETVGRLQHPGIVPVYTVGETRGIPWIAMELVRGCTLAEAVADLSRAGRRPRDAGDLAAVVARRAGADEAAVRRAFAPLGRTWVGVCVRLARMAAEALEHVHRQGVLHRDVKANNLMLTPDGRLLVMDFGLAAAEGTEALTRSGAQLGSLPYMAPEQLDGRIEDLGPATDVYALGVVLYEMLALRLPYRGADAEQMRAQIREGSPPALRRLNPDVPWDAATVVGVAMDRDAGRRYSGMVELARDLDNVLALRPIAARRPHLLLRARRAAQRNPAAATASVLGALLLVAGPLFHAAGAAAERDAAIAAEERARRHAHRASLAAAALHLQAGDAFEADLHLDRVPPGERGWLWNHLRLRADPSLATLARGLPRVRQLAFLDGVTVAGTFADGSLRAWRVDDGTARELPVPRSDHGWQTLAALPRWNLIALGRPGEAVRIHDLDDGRLVRTLDAGAEAAGTADEYRLFYHPRIDALQVFRGDGRVLVHEHPAAPGGPQRTHETWTRPAPVAPGLYRGRAAAGGHELGTVVRLEGARGFAVVRFDEPGAELPLLALRNDRKLGHLGPETVFARVSPDGMRLICYDLRHGLELLQLATPAFATELDGRARIAVNRQALDVEHLGAVRSIAFRDDGSEFATGHASGTICIWDSATGQRVRTLTGHEGGVHGLVWSPDGRTVVSAGADGTLRTWARGELLATRIWRPFYPRGQTRALASRTAVAMHTREQRVALGTAAGTVEVRDLRDGFPLWTVHAHDRRVEDVAWSPSGALLATCASDATLRVFRCGDPQPVFTAGGLPAAVEALCFAAEDRLITADGRGVLRLLGPAGELLDEARTEPLAPHRVAWRGGAFHLWTLDGRHLRWTPGTAPVTGVDEVLRRCLDEMAVHDPTCHSLSAGGDLLLIGTGDGILAAFDARDGMAVLRLEERGASIMRILQDPDGDEVLRLDMHGEVRVHAGRRLGPHDIRLVRDRRYFALHTLGFMTRHQLGTPDERMLEHASRAFDAARIRHIEAVLRGSGPQELRRWIAAMAYLLPWRARHRPGIATVADRLLGPSRDALRASPRLQHVLPLAALQSGDVERSRTELEAFRAAAGDDPVQAPWLVLLDGMLAAAEGDLDRARELETRGRELLEQPVNRAYPPLFRALQQLQARLHGAGNGRGGR